VNDPSIAVVASAADAVARWLARAIAQRGREVLFVDGPAAARLFSIRVSGRDCAVTPQIPMFIRQSAWWSDLPKATPDERFAVSESYSALWSVAALSSAPVINRPDPGGWISHLTAGTIRPFLSAGSAEGMAEVFASSPRHAATDVSDQHQVLWGKNVEQQTGALSSLRDGIPLRARPVDPDEAYEVITVVGDRAFSATNDPRSSEFALQDRSVKLARQACVHFATVTWSVGADAVPVRLNANAHEGELRYARKEVEDALCADLIA
jgi:hypothetical protein